MKKVGLFYREKIVESVIKEWQEAEGRIFISFNKISAFSFNQLRNQLRLKESKLLVTKHSLISRALQRVGLAENNNLLEGPSGLVFTKESCIPDVCKLLVDFSKENEGFSVKCGYLNDKKLEKSDLESISKLPARNVLLGQTIMGLASPLTNFVGILNNILTQFLWLLEDLKKKKEEKSR